VVLRVDEGFGKEKDEIVEEKETPTSYQKGVELVQSANRRVEELLRRIRKGERIDEKELETSRIELRRLALGSCDEPLEERLTYIPSKKLLMEAAMHTTCAYHPKMREFWMLDWEIDLHFLICDLDGKAKREVQFTSADNLKVHGTTLAVCAATKTRSSASSCTVQLCRYPSLRGQSCALSTFDSRSRTSSR